MKGVSHRRKETGRVFGRRTGRRSLLMAFRQRPSEWSRVYAATCGNRGGSVPKARARRPASQRSERARGGCVVDRSDAGRSAPRCLRSAPPRRVSCSNSFSVKSNTGTPYSPSRLRNSMRETPASRAAAPDDSFLSSNSLTAASMRNSALAFSGESARAASDSSGIIIAIWHIVCASFMERSL